MTPETRRNRVTGRDVAAVAGVTTATVSKVLNGSTEVSDATRQRVMDAIRRLGYRPNSVARGLRGRRTHTIGLITDDLEGVFTTTMMRGVEEVASAQQVGVFLCNSYGQEAKERDHLQMLLDKQVDGVILLSGYRVRERGAPAASLQGIPSVYLFQYTHQAPVPCVVPDDVMGARIATEHLADQGRHHIGFINGPPHYEATHDRLDGYQAALRGAGLPVRPELVRTARTWHQDEGYRQVADLLDSGHRLDALLCASDNLALGALDAFRTHGLESPGDIALVGFDDRPFARYQRPPLTSIVLPLYDMGKMAAHFLLDAIAGQPQHNEIHRVPCTLAVRESSARTRERH